MSEGQQVTLWQGDCLVGMARIPDGSIDAVICDLPYGTTACKWDTVIPFAPLWNHYRRIVRPSGAVVLFGAQPFTSALTMSNPHCFRESLVWIKQRPTGFFNARRKHLKTHEDIIVFGPSETTYNPQGTQPGRPNTSGGNRRGNLYGGGVPNQDYLGDTINFPRSLLIFDVESTRFHPTQKPVALLEYLIRTYTNEGETVLDNTMGSGSTGVACINTGRVFVGIEKDETYFEIAQKRICEASAARAESLFAP